MSTAASAGMQAALLIREKQRLRRKKYRKNGRSELPSHIATKEIGPFPQYPPGFVCSQGRAAWQERERGRRCSLSEEARQHRIKQSEAHHRWMKRNRIHDSTYGTGSEEDDFFSVYHQSAAANALLYVGLGTTAIGSVIFFVGTGEKGFKTLELRMIGPTLIACGLICCLIRVLLCACPSTCLRSSRKKNRLKEQDGCAHAGSHYPLTGSRRGNDREYGQVEHTTLLNKTNHKKKVSIVPPNYSLPSTSTSEFKDLPCVATHQVKTEPVPMPVIPQINLPPDLSDEEQASGVRRDDSIIELQNLDLCYDEQSISSDGSDGVTVVETSRSGVSKLTRSREPANVSIPDEETCLSVVIERSDNSDSSDGIPQVGKIRDHGRSDDKQTHSGVVLSPLQLGQ